MTENIEVLTHSSIRISSSTDQIIYIDPYNIDILRNDADYIFITHDHYDHYSPEDIRKVVKDSTVFIVPEKMSEMLHNEGYKNVTAVCPGTCRSILGLEFETVASYNLFKPFHPKKNGWCGYILTIDGKRIYIAGDTDMTKESKAVKCDIAMVPIGATFTMDAKTAAELINIIKPAVAIPTHYGSVVGKPEDADIFAKNVKAPVKVETKIRF